MAISVAENNTLGFGFDLDSCITTGKQDEFCQLINTTDSTPFQVALTASSSVIFNGFKVKASGTGGIRAVGVDLEDSSATFRDDGIRQHWGVKNTTTSSFHEILQAVSNTQITLTSGNIPNGEDYSITDWLFSNATWDESTTYVTASANAVIRRYYSFIPNHYYKVEVTIDTYTAGELDVQLGSNVIGTIDSAGVHTFYGKMDTSDGRICILTGDGSCNMVIAGVNAYEVDTVGIQIKNTDGVVVDEDYDGTYVEYSELTAQIDYDWSQLSDGCYTMCLVNLTVSDQIPDGQFNFEEVVSSGSNSSVVNNSVIIVTEDFVTDGVQDGTNAWGAMSVLNVIDQNVVSVTGRTNPTTLSTTTQATNWTGDICQVFYWGDLLGSALTTINPGATTFSGAGTTLWATPLTLTQGSRYIFRFTIDNYVGGSLTPISINASSTTTALDTAKTADGNYSVEFTASSGQVLIGFQYTGIGGDSLDLEDVQLYELPASTDCSECVKVGTHDCTLLLTATNDDNAFGLNFQDFSFTQSLRVSGRLTNPRYPLDAEVYKFSNGQRKILTGERDKVEQLQIMEVPEYIHDAISIFLICDTFQINGTTYVKSDSDYEPVWRRTSQLAPVIYDVQKGTQDNENASC